MVIANPTKFLPEDEHSGKVFDSPGYEKALKETGYTHEEAQNWWSGHPTGVVVPSVSITLDKSTGNIKVSAPKEMYESEAFKEVFKSSDLESLSRLYKASPNAQVETSEGEIVSIEDMVKNYDEAIKKYAEAETSTKVAKQLMSEILGDDAQQLTQNQIIRMAAVGQSTDENSALSIPKTVSQLFPKIAELSTFSDDSLTRKDFLDNFYNLSTTSGDDIVKLRKVVDGYFEEGDFSDLDEFAKMYALRDFIYNNEPTAGFWEEKGLAGGAVLEGAARATAGFTAGLLSIPQGVSDLLVNTMEGATALLAGAFGQEYTPKKPSEVSFDLINTGIEAVFGTEYLNEELQNQYNERAEYYYTLNRSVATSFMLSNLLTSIAENVVAGKAVGTLIENFTAAVSTQNVLSATAGVKGVALGGENPTAWGLVMNKITGTPTPSFWQTMKALASTDATKILSGTKAYINALSSIEGVAASADFAKVISYATQTIKSGGAIGTGANFIAQVTLDTTLASPTAIRRIISGEATEEDKQIYLREAAWNAAGYGAGILLAKATTSFAKTKVGDAVNSWATQQMASAKTSFHDMMDSVKSKIWGEDWINNIKNPGKRQVARYNEIIAEANRQVANATADIGSTGYAATQTQAVKDARARAIAVQNAVDNLEAGIRRYTNLYMGGNVKDASATYYPALSGSLRENASVEEKLAKSLDELGIETNAKPTALINGVSSNLGVPQDIVNYPNDLFSVDYLTTKQSRDGYLDDDELKGLEIARNRIKKFEVNRPAILADFLKNVYLPAYREVYYQINVHRGEAHLESATNRQGLIDSGLFGKRGELWIHRQAISEFQKAAVDNANRLSSQLSGFARTNDIPDMFHYSWGKEVDYVHPQLALQSYLWQTAVAENARNTWEDFSPIYKEKTELLYTGKQGEAAQTYKNLKGKLYSESKRNLSSFRDDLTLADLVKKIVDSLNAEKAAQKAAAKVERVRGRVESITLKEYKPTKVDKLSAVLSLSDEAVAEIMGEEAISNLALTKQGWDDFIAKADNATLTEIRVRFYEHRQVTGFRGVLDYENYQKTLEAYPELNTEIDRVRIRQNKAYLENDVVVRTAQEQKRAKDLLEMSTTLDNALSQMNLPTTNDKYEAVQAVQRAISNFKEILFEDPAVNQLIDAMAINISPDHIDAFRDYAVLKTLDSMKKPLKIELIKMFNKEKFSELFKKSNPIETERIKNATLELFFDELGVELNDARQTLKGLGEAIADEDDVMADIKALAKDIDASFNDESVVAVYNDQGQLELYRTDPILADLYNYRPVLQPTKAEIVFGNSVFRTTNRVARFFQTTLNPKSYKNQFFRDFGNSYFSTGSYKAMGMISSELQIEYGGKLAEKLINDLKTTSPSTYEFLAQQAENTGTDIKKLVVDRYLSFGRITSPAETPTTFYREPYERDSSFAATLKQTKSKLAEVVDKIIERLETPNQVREVYLRNVTYANGLSEGLKNGLTVKQSQNSALFFQRNGTTNFARQLYHFRALQKTVNYFGAGVNGFTSFWRLFSLDPVGVSTRIFSGLVVPTIVATAVSLSNEENREKYIHLPEYYKNEQFVFMMNGQFYFIPIPQELNSFVAPVRQAVESLYNSNRNAFEELLLSDFLGIGPIDFGAVMMLDRDRLVNDAPMLLDRAGALGLSLIDQTMPNVVKLGFQSVTGVDTFTGDQIDNSYYMIDDDNNRVLVGGTTSKFALQVAKSTGASPSIIAHITESLVGQVGEDILDVLFGGERAGVLVENTLTGLTSFEKANYDWTDREWSSTIAALWDEKESTYLPAYVEYSEKINATSDPKEQEALRTKRQDAIQPFLDKIKTAVGNLKASYGGSYDRFRFASVVSLLTFDTGTTTGNTNEARLAEKETFYENRNNAYWWMTENGLDASTDASILGYITKNADGETVIKYNTPTSILAARDALYGKSSRDVANIQTILDDNNLTRSAMFGGDYNKAKSAGKSALKRYKAEWNTKVVKALAPYIGSRGVESTLEAFAVRDLLDNYLFIDNPYKTKEYLIKIFGGN